MAIRRIKRLYRGKLHFSSKPLPIDAVTAIDVNDFVIGFEPFETCKDDLPDEVLPDVEYFVTELIKSQRFPDGMLEHRQVTMEEWYRFDPMAG